MKKKRYNTPMAKFHKLKTISLVCQSPQPVFQMLDDGYQDDDIDEQI